MYCPSCGEETDEATARCRACGASLDGVDADPGGDPTSAGAETNLESWNAWVLGVLLPVGAVVVFVGGAFLTGIAVGILGGSEEAPESVSTVIGGLVFVLLGLSILVSPYAFHRDKGAVTRATGWVPSNLYYLLCVPVLNVVLGPAYLYQRRSAKTTAGGADGSGPAASGDASTAPAASLDEPDDSTVDLPSDLQFETVLSYGFPLGIGAWIVGALVTTAIFDAGLVTGVPLDVGMFVYVWIHGFVVGTGPAASVTLLDQSVAAVAVWAVIPALPLLLLGASAVKRSGGVPDTSNAGAIAGATLGIGYAIPMVLVALALEVDASAISLLRQGTLALDPLTATLAGLVYGGVFGALGGVTERMRAGRYVRIALAVVFGLLTLLMFAGAGS